MRKRRSSLNFGRKRKKFNFRRLKGVSIWGAHVVGVILLGVAVYFVMSNIKGNDFQDDNVTYVIGR
jgi:hypothetical protein